MVTFIRSDRFWSRKLLKEVENRPIDIVQFMRYGGTVCVVDILIWAQIVSQLSNSV